MCRLLFLRIQAAIESHDQCFIQRFNVVGVFGLFSLQQVIATLRILTYESLVDIMDEYVKIGKSTTIKKFEQVHKSNS